MKFHYPCVLAALLLPGGCATAELTGAFATPTCESSRECQAKLDASETWIRHQAGRTVAKRTDDVIETNMSQSPGNYLSIRIRKVHMAGNTYRLEATMYCAQKVGCDPSPWEATRDYNRYVNQSWVVPD